MAIDPALFIRLYIDEDVHESVAPALRRSGYDAVSVREVNQRGLSDKRRRDTQSVTLAAASVKAHLPIA
jgi:hypothetical protein